MLYTDNAGERRIMVFNHMWRVAKNLFGYFKSADVDATAQFRIRHLLAQAQTLGAKRTKEKLINDLVELLY